MLRKSTFFLARFLTLKAVVALVVVVLFGLSPLGKRLSAGGGGSVVEHPRILK